MKATVLTKFGGPEVLQYGRADTPTWRADQMLVRVAACGVCGHDLLNREGHFPDTHTPCVMGHEIAGTVEEVGALVEGFKPGDRVALTQRISCGVCAACRAGRDNLCRSGPGFYGEEISGGYGEFVIASPRNAVPLPVSIDLDMGAILSCAVGTGYHALNRARLLPGDTVLVTAASGGVGLHTVELARLLGLRVIATTSSERKIEQLRQVGAHEVVAAPDGQFHKAVRELTGGAGVDAVIEIAGGPTFGSSMRSLAVGGRLVAVGNVQPGNVPLNPALPILKEIEIVGSAHALVSDLRRIVE
ncbi:MAG: alcohol dehydrogenase catalytic domain-containing protein, partial [Burkholderiaceae bacterium]